MLNVVFYMTKSFKHTLHVVLRVSSLAGMFLFVAPVLGGCYTNLNKPAPLIRSAGQSVIYTNNSGSASNSSQVSENTKNDLLQS